MRSADMQSPKQRYLKDLQKTGFQSDPRQAEAVEALDLVWQQLIARPPRRSLTGRQRRWPAVQGLYLWGGVGRGKTYLMDQFYESLPFSKKARTHFHRFMVDVHQRRRHYPEAQDPIGKVAAAIARKVRVLCFDEFFVSDIADAMILGRLTEVLFERGVTLIATSNIPPDQLYKDGLQRERFLPAIARVQKNCDVLHLDSPTDYRLRALTSAEIYHWPSDQDAQLQLGHNFDQIAAETGEFAGKMRINGRDIRFLRQAEGVAWFEFDELCETARAAADYIEIARMHHTVLISRVPQLVHELEDAARRFITLVDEFYDRGVKLILAADVPQEQLYAGKRLNFEFERTQSRLTEMQSREYLAQPHLP